MISVVMLTDAERQLLIDGLDSIAGYFCDPTVDAEMAPLYEKLRGYGVKAVLPPMRENEELLG